MDSRRSVRQQNRRDQLEQQNANLAQEEVIPRRTGRLRGPSRAISSEGNEPADLFDDQGIPQRGRPRNQPVDLIPNDGISQRGRPRNQLVDLIPNEGIPQRGRPRN